MEEGNSRRGNTGRRLGRGTRATKRLVNRSVGLCSPLVFTFIDFLQRIRNYYELAIRRNVCNVDAMVAATKAILFHSTDPYFVEYETKAESFSTKVNETRRREREERHDDSSCAKTEKERHQFCLKGPNLVCKWQADAAKKTSSYDPKKSVLPHSFFILSEAFFEIWRAKSSSVDVSEKTHRMR